MHFKNKTELVEGAYGRSMLLRCVIAVPVTSYQETKGQTPCTAEPQPDFS